jgi:hypothetical protein
MGIKSPKSEIEEGHCIHFGDGRQARVFEKDRLLKGFFGGIYGQRPQRHSADLEALTKIQGI